MDKGQFGPLRGVKVIELGGLGPAPYGAMMLAQMGADVVRVDRPGSSSEQMSTLDRGKRSAMIDLQRPEGVEAMLKLIEGADVLIEGFRPGVIERLGMGPDRCWERNPKLVIGRMTGWGQSGPLSQQAGHDVDYIALTGALHAIGRRGDPPTIPLCLVGDLGGGALFLVVGILAALHEAARSGQGQQVDAAIVDGAAALMTPIYGMLEEGGWHDRRGENILDSGFPWYDVYATSDGEWLAVGALEDRFYAELVELLGLSPGEADRSDPAGWSALRKCFSRVFATRTRSEWMAVFDGTDACVSPVLSMTDAPVHPHLVERGTFVDTDGAVLPAPAPRFSRTASEVPHPAPRCGGDTRSVLSAGGVRNVEYLLEQGVAVQT